jgi:hypothetical protein
VVLFFIICIVILSALAIKEALSSYRAVKFAADNNTVCSTSLGETCNDVLANEIFTHTIDNIAWKNEEYSPSLTYLCAQLIQRAYTHEFVTPRGLTHLSKLHDDTKNYPIGQVLKHTSDCGHTTFLIVFRGTSTIEEWKQDFQLQTDNFDFAPKTFYKKQVHDAKLEDKYSHIEKGVTVHSGFSGVAERTWKDISSILTSHFSLNADNNASSNVIVTGHSLGASVATLIGVQIKLLNIPVVVYNFASPRVGNHRFCYMVDKRLKLPLFRIVNDADVIPTTPLAVTPNFKNHENVYLYQHCGKLILFSLNFQSIVHNHAISSYMLAIKKGLCEKCITVPSTYNY